MASYRFSASVLSRSTGRSATAAAAYRAGAEIHCQRYGETHDYTRKGGIVHTEIMAPDHAPSWMHDRAQLWNAVEAAERRKDAQLAREVQLSLPHELDAEQRRELVRSFVAGQFVARGMVADVAIHAPGRQGDDRNHHAHVMLTLREIEGDSFGQKRRDWNARELIETWRAQWAEHQNAFFRHAGIEARVDHRSFEAQGIDREAQQHEGPAASNMRRKGQDTRIGRENDERAQRNAARAAAHVEALKELARVAAERERFESWAHEKRARLEAAQDLSRLDQQRIHEDHAAALEADLSAYYGPHLRTVQAEARAIEQRLSAPGLAAGFRRLFTGKADREKLDAYRATIRDTEQRIAEARGKLEAAQAVEKARLADLQRQRQQEQHEGIERARERKEQSLSARVAEAQKRAAQAFQEKQERQHRAEAERAQAERITLHKADQGRQQEAAAVSLSERVRAAQQRQAESHRQEPDKAQQTEQQRRNQGPEIER